MRQKVSPRVILRVISVVFWIVALGWMIFEPGFEPFLAILGGTATLITSYFVSGTPSKTPSSSQLDSAIDVADKRDETSAQTPNQGAVQSNIESILGKAAIVDHDQLFGVTEQLKQLQMLLSARDSSWIISLFGEGGIGKTALAYEAVRQFAADSRFTRLAWVSAKQRYFSTSAGYQTLQDAKLQWADLVRQMADQLNIELGYAKTLWLEDFRNGIQNLPPSEKCLIVIDNLETIEELSVIKYFDDPLNPSERIIDPHKVLITTRRSIVEESSKVIELPVTGLSPRNAYQFISDLGKTNEAIITATNDELRPILTVTEGNPLLIKLIVRRFLYTRKSIPLILQELRELSVSVIAEDLRNYLYVQSLEELEARVGKDTAKKIMNAFCPRPAGEQLSYEELQRYSEISDAESFETARNMACDLSLIRVSGSTLESRYSIHSLLWEFTCRNI